jgi:arylsulfatase A-like enzyme
MTSTLRRVVALALAIATVMCARNREPAVLGVVLITLDTTRADRLTPYGFMDAQMPAFERLARGGVLFDQAVSVAPLTLPAHASIMTGLWPPAHGVRDNVSPPLAEPYVTLAEVLRGQGFRTAAFVGSNVLHRDRGLSQGFEHYGGPDRDGRPGHGAPQRPAAEVVSEATQWLRGINGSRFFAWLHLYDPHRPYEPPEPYATMYASDPYIGEIAYADAQVGVVLDTLEQQGVLDQTLVVVAGDHGESLGDHGERDHGVFVYESVLRVPLLIRAPSLSPGRVGSVVRLIDVMPTTLALLGVRHAPSDGADLTALMQGHHQELEAYSESLYPQRFGWSPLRALRDGRFKLIDAPRPELYDLQRDPFEEHNIYDQRGTVATAMRRRLATFSGSEWPADQSVGNRQTVSSEVKDRLAALGYVTSAPVTNLKSGVRLPDPKDLVGREPAFPGQPWLVPADAIPKNLSNSSSRSQD